MAMTPRKTGSVEGISIPNMTVELSISVPHGPVFTGPFLRSTGRIDFATQLNGNEDTQQSEFKLLVEERRIVETIAENLEIQWRLATLRETKPS